MSGTSSLRKASSPGLECSTTGKTVTTKSESSMILDSTLGDGLLLLPIPFPLPYSFRLLLFYVGSFDDFLMDMKQSKRKNIRQERKKVDICRFYQLVLEFYPIALSSVCVFISIRQ